MPEAVPLSLIPAEWRSAVLVAAHPDDETIGIGAQLDQFAGHVTMVHVTDGAPRDGRDAQAAGFAGAHGYATARRRELEAALGLAGVPPHRILSLGFVDQETYLSLERITLALWEILRRLSPHVVITHPYEGGHPDHDSTAFAVHGACRLMENAPFLAEFTSYHRAPDDSMRTFEFLPDPGPVRTVELSDGQRRRKRAMLDCFETQRHVVQNFPVERERLRLAPRYDFRRAPHAGPLFYERFDWGVQGAGWRTAASRALEALFAVRVV